MSTTVAGSARVLHIMVVLRHSRETAGLSTTNISVARQHFSGTDRDITSPRAAPATGGREYRCRRAGGTPLRGPLASRRAPPRRPLTGLRGSAHTRAPPERPRPRPHGPHIRAPPRRPPASPRGQHRPTPGGRAPASPRGHHRPHALATPPGESSWPPQPYPLGTQGDPPRSKALPPHAPGGPAAKLQWRATNQQRTSAEPKTALPPFNTHNTTTPQR